MFTVVSSLLFTMTLLFSDIHTCSHAYILWYRHTDIHTHWPGYLCDQVNVLDSFRNHSLQSSHGKKETFVRTYTLSGQSTYSKISEPQWGRASRTAVTVMFTSFRTKIILDTARVRRALRLLTWCEKFTVQCRKKGSCTSLFYSVLSGTVIW